MWSLGCQNGLWIQPCKEEFYLLLLCLFRRKFLPCGFPDFQSSHPPLLQSPLSSLLLLPRPCLFSLTLSLWLHSTAGSGSRDEGGCDLTSCPAWAPVCHLSSLLWVTCYQWNRYQGNMASCPHTLNGLRNLKKNLLSFLNWYKFRSQWWKQTIGIRVAVRANYHHFLSLLSLLIFSIWFVLRI